MAIASYFNKNILAMNHLLHSDGKEYLNILTENIIGIVFSENAVTTSEGRAALELVIRLLARFYPKIAIMDIQEKYKEHREKLINLAKSINNQIEIVSNKVTFTSIIVAGELNTDYLPPITPGGIKIYLGSEEWDAKISFTNPQRFNQSNNPFGCGAAACISASILFGHIFRDSLGEIYNNSDINFSTLYLQQDGASNPPINEVKLNDVALVGVGAIGNGFIWAISNIPSISGVIHLIDKELVSNSNLQRYILADENDINVTKTEIASKYLEQNNLEVDVHQKTWAEYVAFRNDWNINCVAVGVDNKRDRIGIQSTLPKIIFNSFTEPEVIGISRHLDFLNEPCLGCSYIPIEKVKNYTQKVADSLNIPDKSEMIKDYLNRNQPADNLFLGIIAEANSIDVQKIKHYEGIHIEQFYSEFVCGGILLNLSGNAKNMKEIDAPIAFQSALAGILLAAELVKYFGGYPIENDQRTDVYFLHSFGKANPLNRPLQKDTTRRCICWDEDYRLSYKNKWKIH